MPLDRKPSICFVALNAYNVLAGREDIDHIGGAEVQQVRIASWLVHRGYPVSFVTLDHGQPDGVNLNGIVVRKAYAKEDGVDGLKFIHPRWSGLWAAMTRANADLYYQRAAGCETGQVALWCRLHRRRFIFAVANDGDCDLTKRALRFRRERTLYRVGVRLANGITAQTVTQQDLLRRNMGLSAVLVRNCGWRAGDGLSQDQPSPGPSGFPRVLWVGRISEQKRLEWLLDVAERFPRVLFDVVGAPNTDSTYASGLLERAARISNVEMHGPVRHADMIEYYRKCHVLCCTSAREGFPNTFLEAWSLGIPVVSTFDPDGAIDANGLGWVAQDVEGIAAHLEELARAPEIWVRAARAARQYYLGTHTPDACLPVLERLLLRVAGFGSDSQ